FIEYLVPALELTAVSCALQRFVSDVGEFRPAVSQVLKKSHVERALYGLMFYSQLRRLNLVSLHVGKVHGRNDLLVRNNLVVLNRIPELLTIRRLHAAERFPPHANIHLASGRGKALRSPPLLHVLLLGPRLPDQFAWGIENPCNNHPLNFVNHVFRHLWPPLASFDLPLLPACRNSLPRIGDSGSPSR